MDHAHLWHTNIHEGFWWLLAAFLFFYIPIMYQDIKDHFKTVKEMQVRLTILEGRAESDRKSTAKIMYELDMAGVDDELKEIWAREDGWIDNKVNR
jgi:hypothetical protein